MITNNNTGQEILFAIQGLLQDMLEISIQQKRLLESGPEITWPMDTMLKLQGNRQDIMKRMEELSILFDSGAKLHGLEILHNNQGQDYFAHNVDDYQDIMRQIKNIIMEINLNDHYCQEKLEKGKEKMLLKMSQVKESKKAQEAYLQEDVDAPAWFFDKKK